MGAVNNTQVRIEALELLKAQPGVPEHYTKIAECLGIDPGQVTNILARLAKVHPELGVSRVGAGMYVFRVTDSTEPTDAPHAVPEPEPEPKLTVVPEPKPTIEEVRNANLAKGRASNHQLRRVSTFPNGDLLLQEGKGGRMWRATPLD